MLKNYIGDKKFYKKLMVIALPIMLQNGITNFVNMLDNIMVGSIGTVEMTGVSVANQLIFVFNLCLFGAVSGAGIFGAQFFGKKDHEGMRYCLRFKLLLCAVLLVIGALVLFLFGTPLTSLFLRGEGSVEDAKGSLLFAKEYIDIMIIGLIPFTVVQCYASTLREANRAVLPMKAGIIAITINLLFNYLLIFGNFGFPKLGVAGAAYATVISRFVEMFIVVIWSHKNKKALPFMEGLYSSFKIPMVHVRGMIIKGLPLMINEALWSSGVTAINMCYSLCGLSVVPALNISQTFWNLFSVSFIATGSAIGIMVGQMLGAGKFEEVKDTVRKLSVFTVAIGITVGVLYALLAGLIPDFYNTTDEVKSIAASIMVASGLIMPINAYAHVAYFTIRAGGKTMITVLLDSVFKWFVSFPVAYVLTKYTGLGIITVYILSQGTDFFKCIIGYALLKKGVWIRNIVNDV